MDGRPATPHQRFAHSHAILIGIDAYRRGIPRLMNAVRDVRALGKVLAAEHHYTVTTLVGRRASRPILLDLLRRVLPQRVGAGDRVLFYFAGHGQAAASTERAAGFLLPSDADPDDPGSFLDMTDVYDGLDRLPCRHLLVVLDCCFAGTFRWPRTRDIGRSPIYRESYDRFVASRAWQALTSAASDQHALDAFTDRGEPQRRSPFADALLRGIAGAADWNRDGLITATDLYGFVREEVERITSQRYELQSPGLFPMPRHERGEFVFAVPARPLTLPPLTDDANPYRGLDTYGRDDRALLFGRTDDEARLLAAIAERRLTIVVGASGTGKSSLLAARVVPALADQHWAIVGPLRAGEAARAGVVTIPTEAAGRVLIVIDQVEELITQGVSDVEIAAFQRTLRSFLDDQDVDRRLVLVVRSDYEPFLRKLLFADLWSAARCFLAPMTHDQLRQVIEGPARLREVFFDPLTLVDQLINEVVQMPGALPLLSLTLTDLYRECTKRPPGRADTRAITSSEFDTVGGVATAVTRRAENELRALESTDPGYQQTARNVMLRMISREGGGLARRRIQRSRLNYAPAENARVLAFLEHFVNARLLVGSGPLHVDPDAWVEPAHDALILGWDRLRTWMAEVRDLEPTLAAVSADALIWVRDPSDGLLWTDDPRLALLLPLVVDGEHRLTAGERAFVARSQDRREAVAVAAAAAVAATTAAKAAAAQAKARRRNIALSVAVVAAVSFAGLALFARRAASRADRARDEATRNLAESDAHLASSLAAAPGREGQALALALDAFMRRTGDATPTQRLALQDGLAAIRRSLPLHFPDAQNVEVALVDPIDQASVVAADADGHVCVFDVRTGAHPPCIQVDRGIADLAISPDGTLLCVASFAEARNHGRVHLYGINRTEHMPSFAYQRTLRSSDSQALPGCVFGHGPTPLIAVPSDDGHVYLWRRPDAEPVDLRVPHQCAASPDRERYYCSISRVALAPDDATLVAGAWSGNLYRWTAPFGPTSLGTDVTNRWRERDPNERKIVALEYSPDGQWLLLCNPQICAIRKVPTDEVVHELAGHDREIDGAHWSPRGDRLITHSWDHSARISRWDDDHKATTFERSLGGHAYFVFDARFAPDDRRVVTASNDGVRVWDSELGQSSFHASPDCPWKRPEEPCGPGLLSHDLPRPSAEDWRQAIRDQFNDLSGKFERPDDHGYETAVVTAVSDDLAHVVTVYVMPGVVWIWNLPARTGRVLATLPAHQLPQHLAISGDGALVAIEAEGKVVLMDTALGRARYSQFLHYQITGLSFTADGKNVVVAAMDGTTVLDVATLTAQQLAPPGRLRNGFAATRDRTIIGMFRNEHPDAALCQDNNEDCVGDVDQRYYLLTGQRFVSSPLHPHTVRALAFASDGTIASSSTSTMSLWDGKAASVETIVKGYANVVTALAFSPDSRWVAGGSAARQLHLYDRETHRHWVASGHRAGIRAVGFSPDGRVVWTAGSQQDGTLRLWSLVAGDAPQPIAVLEGLTAGVEQVIWPAGADEIVVVDGVGTLRWYPVTDAAVVAHACAMLRAQPEFDGAHATCDRALAARPP